MSLLNNFSDKDRKYGTVKYKFKKPTDLPTLQSTVHFIVKHESLRQGKWLPRKSYI